MATPTVADVRRAIDQQEWADALEAAGAATTADDAEAAELADLRAEAAWWLGRIDVLRNAERLIQCEDHREKR